MSRKSSLVFFGTGTVSLGTLAGIANDFDIEVIITRPAKHHPTMPPPVEAWAKTHKVPLFQPADSDKLEELFIANRFESPAGLVVDYGLIIPETVIKSFAKGIVNSHFSLLPEWRGADPITAAILSGQRTTGVSLMLIVPELDEGKLLAQVKYEIPADITIDRLTKELTELSNQLLTEQLPQYLAGKLKPYPQDQSISLTYTRKLTKSDGIIDWQKPAEALEREIRAYKGWPGSQTKLAGKNVLLTGAHVVKKQGNPGDVFMEGQDFGVYTSQNGLLIDRLKPAGKAEMSGADFRRGYLR